MVELYGMTVRCDSLSYKGMGWYARVDVGSWSGEGPQRYSEAEARADLPGVLRAAVSTALPPAEWDDLTAKWQHCVPTADGSEAELVVELDVWSFGDGQRVSWEAWAYLGDVMAAWCMSADDPKHQVDLAAAKAQAEDVARALFARFWVDANAKALGIGEV